MMRVNVVDINFNKLEEEINKVENETGKNASLFMSRETLDSVEKLCNVKPLDENFYFDRSNGRVAVYKGNDIYINDGHRYGEVNVDVL
jgi:hypothetical protein